MKKPVYLILLLSIVLLQFSCDEDDKKIEPDETSINIFFEHFVGDEPAIFGSVMYMNEFGNLYSIERLQYFISDIKITGSDGSVYLFDDEYYVDAKVDETLLVQTGQKIPAGNYNSISFIYGISEEKNTSGRFPNPPESLMEWPLPMGGGYHYMKLEGKIEIPGSTDNFQAHTGPTMGNQNFVEIELPQSSFVLSGKERTLAIRMNINNWWKTPNVLDLNTLTSIMGDQEMQLKLKANSMDVFSFAGIQ
jgi:hypothetical protein